MIIYECSLELHDNLFFATREMGRFYETSPYIHNYALTYALGYSGNYKNFPVSPYFCPEQIPTYKNDLKGLSFYVTPAKPVKVEYAFNTFKLGEPNYYLVSTVGNTQHRKLGISDSNYPSYGKAKEIKVGSKYLFFILTEEKIDIPKWIRLGKWMSKANIEIVKEILISKSKTGEYYVRHPLNPLDIPDNNEFIIYDILAMPPVSLINNAIIKGDFIEIETHDKKNIKLPANLKYRF